MNDQLSAFEYRAICYQGHIAEIVNPYLECSYGCRYCYCRSVRREARKAAGNGWDAELPKRWAGFEQLLQRDNNCQYTFIGTAVDSYPIREWELEITRSILQACARHGRRVVIATKSPLVTRDIDFLSDCVDSLVFLSLASMSPDWSARFEPSAPPIDERLECIENLSKNAVDVAVFVAPILPDENDQPVDLDRTLRAITEAGARFCVVGLATAQTPGIRRKPDCEWYDIMSKRIEMLSTLCPEVEDGESFISNKLGPVGKSSLVLPVEGRGLAIIQETISESVV